MRDAHTIHNKAVWMKYALMKYGNDLTSVCRGTTIILQKQGKFIAYFNIKNNSGYIL